MAVMIPLKGFSASEKKWGLSRKFEYNEMAEKYKMVMHTYW